MVKKNNFLQLISNLGVAKKDITITVADCCAGSGMTALAIKRAAKRLGIKVRIVAYAEIDKFACQAYEKIHSAQIPNLGDITVASYEGMKVDILIMTFPCTAISVAGKQEGLSEGSDTASSIVWEIVRMLEEMEEKPKMIFFENVAALLNKKFRPEFEKLKAFLESQGYHVHYANMDAQDYGVPQHRERVYILASLDDVAFEFPSKEPLEIELKDILESEPDKKYFLNDVEHKINITNARGYSFRVHNPGKAHAAFTLTTRGGYQSNSNYIFASDVSEDCCIRFTPKNSADLDVYKKKPVRMLTRLEMGRLMGLTDEEIHKLDFLSLTQFAKIMGNGIVVPVVEKIFYNYLKAWLKIDCSNDKAA